MLPAAQPKPKPRASTKRANRREAAKIVRQVRAACVDRDGHCRVLFGNAVNGDIHQGEDLNYCGLRSEWAHLNEHQRFKTRGQEPEERHCTAGSLMLCEIHHQLLDSHQMAITALSDRGADGPLCFERLS